MKEFRLRIPPQSRQYLPFEKAPHVLVIMSIDTFKEHCTVCDQWQVKIIDPNPNGNSYQMIRSQRYRVGTGFDVGTGIGRKNETDYH